MGRILRKIKTSFYKLFHKKLRNCKLYDCPRIYFNSKLIIGTNTTINDSIFIHAAGGVEIGKNCVLSHGVTILSIGLSTKDWDKRNITKDSHVCKKVSIGNNVWLCANVTVCPGVTIANNVIVAAGAVVCEDLKEPNSLYGGIPAKRIKDI